MSLRGALAALQPPGRMLQRERRRAACAPPHPPAGAAKQQPGGADPSRLAPAWSCSHSTEAALRQAEMISKLLLRALLPSATPAAAGAL